LYDVGIDARSGPPSGSVTPSYPMEAEMLSSITEQSSPNLDTPSPGTPSARRKSYGFLMPQPAPRLWGSTKQGNAIGSSSGARRKSSSSQRSTRIRIDDSALEHQRAQDSKPWVKPRKDSGWPAAKSPSPEATSRKVSQVSQLSQISQLSQASEVSQMSSPGYTTADEEPNTKNNTREDQRSELVSRLAPLLSKADHAGIYGVMTGSESQKAEAACNVECHEHACGSSRYASRAGSVDWIA
jgi:hypothetical protein